MVVQWLGWYLVMLLVAVAAAPLAMRLFDGLPVRGLLLARPLGILLTGYVLWIGFALGLLSNDSGGAWVALILVAGVSAYFGRNEIAELRTTPWKTRDWRTLLLGEMIFLVAFALWATVRAYDPAARHTEQPMDLMFMNSLWTSQIFPPQDAWLSGYPISYYYFGYWLLVTMGRLAGTLPEVAYNLGQAAWFGMLLSLSFGLAVMLLRVPFGRVRTQLGHGTAWLGGLLAALMVGVTTNIQGMLEWLHAQGVNITWLANFAQVRGFPENAPVTNKWYLSFGDWWWWRSSRVLADYGLDGGHQEVIAEYPAFSYILGDNHPHVLAMPIVILGIGLILAWFMGAKSGGAEDTGRGWRTLLPGRWLHFAILTVVLGSLLATNTWDFPPYLLLFGLAAYTAGQGNRLLRAVVAGLLLAAGAIVLYLPYFITAQSQADGFNINFFNPTRLPQFLWMFGVMLLGVLVLYLVAWRDAPPRFATLAGLFAVSLGAPLLFLGGSWWLTSISEARMATLMAWMPLPEGSSDYLPLILGRWRTGIWTLVLIALLLAIGGALWWRRAQDDESAGDEETLRREPISFALLMCGVALLLVFAPEFIFLDDNFGWRMNTIFKFYYQAWLLMGIAGAVGITHAFAGIRKSPVAAIVATPAVALTLFGCIFLIAGGYSRAGGFATTPTFDASAWIADFSPGQRNAALWLRENAPADAVIAEAIGSSYLSDQNIVSTLSGRPTLIGWEGHERQWRGNEAYGEMAAGRTEALEEIYRYGMPDDVLAILDQYSVDYVVVGPNERNKYALSSLEIARLDAMLERVFEERDVLIYARP
jgi:YYY domain-containing protein